MTRLRKESHARMLGNGMCTRPVELECRMESAARPAPTSRPAPSSSPSCFVNETTPASNGQTDRAALFDDLVAKVSEAST